MTAPSFHEDGRKILSFVDWSRTSCGNRIVAVDHGRGGYPGIHLNTWEPLSLSKLGGSRRNKYNRVSKIFQVYSFFFYVRARFNLKMSLVSLTQHTLLAAYGATPTLASPAARVAATSCWPSLVAFLRPCFGDVVSHTSRTLTSGTLLHV